MLRTFPLRTRSASDYSSAMSDYKTVNKCTYLSLQDSDNKSESFEPFRMNGNRNPQMGNGLSAGDLINSFGEDIFEDEGAQQYEEYDENADELDQGPEWEDYDYDEEYNEDVDYAHDQVQVSYDKVTEIDKF